MDNPTIWHFHGGCEVGYVVNQKYQVNGVEGLRIVDASTFTNGPGTNPRATTMMLAGNNQFSFSRDSIAFLYQWVS